MRTKPHLGNPNLGPTWDLGLATDGTNVFWIETNGTARIGSVPVAGGSITTSRMTAPALTGGAVMAVDATSFYWTIFGSNARMRGTLPVSSASTAKTMATTSVGSNLAEDATALYGSSAAGMMKIAKQPRYRPSRLQSPRDPPASTRRSLW